MYRCCSVFFCIYFLNDYGLKLRFNNPTKLLQKRQNYCAVHHQQICYRQPESPEYQVILLLLLIVSSNKIGATKMGSNSMPHPFPLKY